MSHEKKVSTKKPMTIHTAINYIADKWGETACVVKIKVGHEVIFNKKYQHFDVEKNLSIKLTRANFVN